MDRSLSHLPVPDRLRARLADWEHIVASPWATSVVAHGLWLPFRQAPTPWRHPGARSKDSQTDQVLLGQEQVSFRDLGVTSTYARPARRVGTGYRSPMFVVHQKAKVRAVFSATRLNRFITYRKFKMEGLHSVRDLMQRCDFMTKLDIKKAYFHVAVHPQHRKYLRFVDTEGAINWFNCLPFGVTNAPRDFSKLIRQILKVARRHGLRIVHYIDDFLILARSKDESNRHTKFFALLLVRLGFWMAWDKSEVEPAQQIEFLGTLIDSIEMSLLVPVHKIAKVCKEIREFTQARDGTARRGASVVGKLVSMTSAMAPCSMHRRALTMAMGDFIRQTRGDYDVLAEIPTTFKDELLLWSRRLTAWNGHALIPPVASVVVQTDAATSSGWGAVRLDTGVAAHGQWSEADRGQSINFLELKAVLLALDRLELPRTPSIFHFQSDNTTAVACLNGRNRAKAPGLRVLCAEIREICLQRQWTILASFLPGVENRLADHLSRNFEHIMDWRLPIQLFRMVERRWGPHTIDLFSSRSSRQLKRFYSWLPEKDAEGLDAFSHSWKDENGYANPPFNMISRVLKQAIQEELELTIICPVWPSQVWFPLLMMLVIDSAALPQDAMLHAVRDCPRIQTNPAWEFRAYRISGKSWKGAESKDEP
jgi:hypothetical protein